MFSHKVNALFTGLIARRQQVLCGFQTQALKRLRNRRFAVQQLAPGYKRSNFFIAGDLILNPQTEGMTIEHTQDNGAFSTLEHYRCPSSSAVFQRNMAEPEPVRIGPNAAGQLGLELSHGSECLQTARIARNEQKYGLRMLMVIKRRLTSYHHRPLQQIRALRGAQGQVANAADTLPAE
ncbi:MAG: hypothetical protein L0G28_01895 [Pseudomonas sp.]|uniref:hypothetical protein n=1 Tax=Pseudomonas bubulae TaxID=2316085 RepID=UPI002648D203|nr:hypothetical protein [Pseudomonas sp.]MDN5452024.1 hypothetical protein [Pseudomonas sp.]